MELLYPLLIEQMEIEPDSMGFGEWNGGPGVRLVARPTRGDMECITFGDGYNNPPHGVLGGTAAIGGGMYIEAPEGGRRFLSATTHVAVAANEKMVGVASGGGGYGNPLDRDIELVRTEVRDGFITRDAARAEFGVVVSAEVDPQIDMAATEALRAELALRQRPMVTPTEPNSSTWLAEHITDADEYLVNAKLALSEIS